MLSLFQVAPLLKDAASVVALARKLYRWGYLSVLGSGAWLPDAESLERGIAKYQARYGLTVTGRCDEPTLHLIARRFCGCRDIEPFSLAASSPAKWPHLDVTFSTTLQLRQADLQQQRDAILAEVLDEINGHCGLRMRHVAGGGNIRQTGASARIDRELDGAGGTLAYAFLPDGRTRATDWLSQVIDIDERWSRKMLFLTELHETLHSVGVEHNADGQVALMDPHLNMDLDGLQPWDIAELVKRYPHDPQPAPVPVPRPPSDDPAFAFAVELSGRRYVAEGTLKAV